MTGSFERHEFDQRHQPDPVHAADRRSNAARELQHVDGRELHRPRRLDRPQYFPRRRRLSVRSACDRRRQRERQLSAAHRQHHRPRRAHLRKRHPCGRCDQRRHDCAGRIHARAAGGRGTVRVFALSRRRRREQSQQALVSALPPFDCSCCPMPPSPPCPPPAGRGPTPPAPPVLPALRDLALCGHPGDDAALRPQPARHAARTRRRRGRPARPPQRRKIATRLLGPHHRHARRARSRPQCIFGAGPRYDYTFAGLQAGHDLYRREARDGSRDHAGIYLAVGDARWPRHALSTADADRATSMATASAATGRTSARRAGISMR